MTETDLHIRAYDTSDGPWVVDAHARLYASEEGYDDSFRSLVSGIVDAFETNFDIRTEAGWIVEKAGTRLGCIFCVRVDGQTAKLRLFLVEPAARGLGLGRQLLNLCMTFARHAGYHRMVLWTHESHEAACALYAQTGWRIVSSVPGHEFGVDVVDQEWEVTL